MKKLTKSQERILHHQLVTDELMYQKYQYMLDKIVKEHKRLIANPQHIKQIIYYDGNGTIHDLQIKKIWPMMDGSIVEVIL